MEKYNHAFTFNFSINSNHEDGQDITADEFRAAIIDAVKNIDDASLLENCGMPFDTYENEEVQ